VTHQGGSLRVVIPGRVDASVYRYLSFRYRFPPNLKIDLTAYATDPDPEKRRMVVKLTDADVRPDYVVMAGRIEGIRRDDRWHTALVDLKEQMQLRQHLEPDAKITDWNLTSIAFDDAGFNWARPGTTFYLDDVVIQAGGPRSATFRLEANDESGIKGFACSFDRDPEGVPGEDVNVATSATFEASFPEKGVWYVHACAVDGAGNRSQPAHYTYIAE
jgi:hypothetical protein